MRRPGLSIVLAGGAAGRAGDPGAADEERHQRRRPAARRTCRSSRPTTRSRRSSRPRASRRPSSSRPTTCAPAPPPPASPRCATQVDELRCVPARDRGHLQQGRHGRPDQRPDAAAAATTPRPSHALNELRDEIIPATVGRGRRGDASTSAATRPARRTSPDQLNSRLPLIFAFVFGLAFLLHARHVPLDRDPDQGDHAQPALGRGRLRRARARLPERPRRVAARLHLERRGDELAAAVPVRGPVRALDGLPRVHPVPGPRAPRPRHEHRRGGQAGASRRPPGP